jgi:hypothetical protein
VLSADCRLPIVICAEYVGIGVRCCQTYVVALLVLVAEASSPFVTAMTSGGTVIVN